MAFGEIASPGQLRASFIRWALVTVPAVVLLGLLAGQLSGSGSEDPWFAMLQKPALYPPPATFGIVWTILYILLGLAFALVLAAKGARGRGKAIVAFIAQLIINLAWSPLFFGLHQITWALVLLVAMDIAVVVTIFLFWRVRVLAAVLMLPYLAWILFATYLNAEILMLNPELDGQEMSGAAVRVEF